jgi:hypothetical protein
MKTTHTKYDWDFIALHTTEFYDEHNTKRLQRMSDNGYKLHSTVHADEDRIVLVFEREVKQEISWDDYPDIDNLYEAQREVLRNSCRT